MNKANKLIKRKYFAAANSYRGFVSLFDEVFKSTKYDRLYVLKGGPGTGKSSFMKKVSSRLTEKFCDVDEIYCSSDPNSLDGIIACKNGKKIAIIDGTAPHERDAKIPGAIDEIIDLAIGFDTRWLRSKREEILSIGEEKKKAYESGYAYLKIAGESNNMIKEEQNQCFDKTKAKIKAEEILSLVPTSESIEISNCFISSFGRYGRYKIDDIENIVGKVVHVGGDDYTANIFISFILRLAKNKGVSFCRYLSPLDNSLCEGAQFIDANIAIVKSDFGEVDSKSYFLPNKVSEERTRRALEIKKEALEEAERWFAIAADLHSRLEEIYGGAMDFSLIDELFDKKMIEIENILQI